MIKPLGERIILRPIDEENKTKSGIVFNDKPKQECFGEVVCMSEKTSDFVKYDIKVGDKVVYPKIAVLPVEIEGEKFIIANINDILAVIR